MQHPLLQALLACAAALACSPAVPATGLGDLALDEFAQVGGHSLQLNGAGISTRLLFRIYAMGLYLPSRLHAAQEVLAAEGPRRITIVPLRNISGNEFSDAVMHDLSPERVNDPGVLSKLVLLAQAVARHPGGLRTGDVLTLDWVPEVGAVVALNRRPLTAPVPNAAFYKALLEIWLGDNPTDPALKSRLLGRARPSPS